MNLMNLKTICLYTNEPGIDACVYYPFQYISLPKGIVSLFQQNRPHNYALYKVDFTFTKKNEVNCVGVEKYYTEMMRKRKTHLYLRNHSLI